MPDEDRGNGFFSSTFDNNCGCDDNNNLGDCDCGCNRRNGNSSVLFIIALIILLSSNRTRN